MLKSQLSQPVEAHGQKKDSANKGVTVEKGTVD
jgi:hypothetical protein